MYIKWSDDDASLFSATPNNDRPDRQKWHAHQLVSLLFWVFVLSFAANRLIRLGGDWKVTIVNILCVKFSLAKKYQSRSWTIVLCCAQFLQRKSVGIEGPSTVLCWSKLHSTIAQEKEAPPPPSLSKITKRVRGLNWRILYNTSRRHCCCCCYNSVSKCVHTFNINLGRTETYFKPINCLLLR